VMLKNDFFKPSQTDPGRPKPSTESLERRRQPGDKATHKRYEQLLTSLEKTLTPIALSQYAKEFSEGAKGGFDLDGVLVECVAQHEAKATALTRSELLVGSLNNHACRHLWRMTGNCCRSYRSGKVKPTIRPQSGQRYGLERKTILLRLLAGRESDCRCCSSRRPEDKKQV